MFKSCNKHLIRSTLEYFCIFQLQNYSPPTSRYVGLIIYEIMYTNELYSAVAEFHFTAMHVLSKENSDTTFSSFITDIYSRTAVESFHFLHSS